MMKKLLALALLAGAGCATTTNITSDPSGAVVVDETTKKEIGKTPMKYESKMWLWESQKLTLKAPGKKDKTIELKRSDVDVMPTVGSVCLAFLPPCFLIQGGALFAAGGMKFPDVTNVKLENGSTPPPTGMLDDGITPADKLCMRY
jgi:hypothetical protein